jgi:hypothetical protein
MTEPLEGILKTGDFGDSKHYYVACSCGSTDCAHDVEVEVVGDDCDVSVNIYITANNDFWTEHFKTRYDSTSWQNPFKNFANAFLRKLKFTWEVWIKGETEFQTTIVLSEAAAKNYSQALDKAADDVKLFKKQYIEKNAKRIKE